MTKKHVIKQERTTAPDDISAAPEEEQPRAGSQPETNPFYNKKLTGIDRALDKYHGSDHPGADYNQPSKESLRHPGRRRDTIKYLSTGTSNPSAPRRPGTGTRQSSRRRHEGSPVPQESYIPGEILHGSGDIEINIGLPVTVIRVANNTDRPVQVGSHYHFAEANPGLEFDREAAWGKHLNIISGGAMRFEPGADEEVELVPMGGKRLALGFRGECGCSLDG